MVNFNLAYSAPVNPAGSSPVVSLAQLWKGMERKVRHGDEFVPAILSCDVEKENTDGTEIVRRVVFKQGHGMRPEVTERCVLKQPSRVRLSFFPFVYVSIMQAMMG